MQVVFIGSDAIASADVTRHEPQHWYEPIYPGVYAAKGQQLSLRRRTEGAWLWSWWRAIVAGVAASALHGARWVDADSPIELVWSNTRPPRGIVAREQLLADDETDRVAGLPGTTPVRTAYDLGRYLQRGQAVARLDSLMRATPFSTEDVRLLAERYLAARGDTTAAVGSAPRRRRRRLPEGDLAAAPTHRRGSAHPNHPDTGGRRLPRLAMLDIGWPEFGVAAEYDGDHHRSDRRRYVKDQWRLRKLAEMGWIVIRVIAEDKPEDVRERVRRALLARGWRSARLASSSL
jgi:hypothetical protein